MSSPPMDVLRDAKYRALKVGDTVQLAHLHPGGPAGEVVDLRSSTECVVEWWGYGYDEPQVLEAQELRVIQPGDNR